MSIHRSSVGARIRRLARGSLLAALVCTLGCASVLSYRPPGWVEYEYTEQDLREDLSEFAARYALIVTGTGERISAATTDRQVRKRALLWRVRFIPLIHGTTSQDDPQEAFVTTLTLVVAQDHYLTVGEGKNAFGDQQELALEASRSIALELAQIGKRFLTPEQMERLKAEVMELARRETIKGPNFAAQGFQSSLAAVATEAGTFDWVVDLPMSPFRALEGVGSGAQAIHEFNKTAARLTDIVALLPEQIRAQTELLLYDVEDRQTLARGLGAFESISESATRASEAIDRLPNDMQRTLLDSQQTLAEVNQAIVNARELVGPLSVTAERLQMVSSTWVEFLDRNGADEPPGRPFDVREWESTAQEIGVAADRLHELALGLTTLTGSPQIAGALGAVNSTVERVEASAMRVVNAAAWRLFQLLLAFFALLCVALLLAHRLAIRRRARA
jgi:hypothetical protein